jgi:hypothetical protein
MKAVMDAERALGHEVIDVSAQKCGWDVTSLPKAIDGKLPPSRHIEVKGRAKGQSTITVTRNEILYGLNQQDKFILAIVIVDGDSTKGRSTSQALHAGTGLGRDQHQSGPRSVRTLANHRNKMIHFFHAGCGWRREGQGSDRRGAVPIVVSSSSALQAVGDTLP